MRASALPNLPGHAGQRRPSAAQPITPPARSSFSAPVAPSQHQHQHQHQPWRGDSTSTQRVHGAQGADDANDVDAAQQQQQEQQQQHEGEQQGLEEDMTADAVEEMWRLATATAEVQRGAASPAQLHDEQDKEHAARSSGSGGHVDARGTLSVLLPCLEPALRARGANEAALRLTADLLAQPSSTLLRTAASINRAEKEALALLSGLLSRSHDAEPEERAQRNALVRTMWEGFATARQAPPRNPAAASAVDGMQRHLQEYRRQYRARTVQSLSLLVAAACEQPVPLATRLVLLRGMVAGNLSHLMLRYPALATVPMDNLLAAAGKVQRQEQEQEGGIPPAGVSALLLDQRLMDALDLTPSLF